MSEGQPAQQQPVSLPRSAPRVRDGTGGRAQAARPGGRSQEEAGRGPERPGAAGGLGCQGEGGGHQAAAQAAGGCPPACGGWGRGAGSPEQQQQALPAAAARSLPWVRLCYQDFGQGPQLTEPVLSTSRRGPPKQPPEAAGNAPATGTSLWLVVEQPRAGHGCELVLPVVSCRLR